jgi:hypothetical protein
MNRILRSHLIRLRSLLARCCARLHGIPLLTADQHRAIVREAIEEAMRELFLNPNFRIPVRDVWFDRQRGKTFATVDLAAGNHIH